jgi:HAD superfamily hydrolase (TIGR01509 family)
LTDPPTRAVFLDAGNTIVFLDHQAVADVVSAHGHAIEARALRDVEGKAKRRYEALMKSGASHEDGWGLYLVTLLSAAGLGETAARAMVAPLRRAHDAHNLWRRVPDGLHEALVRLREAGIHVSVISNSEGALPTLFARVGLAPLIAEVIDSHHEGVRKPDPELFRRALARTGQRASESVYLGDIPGVDVVGAHAAGMRAVLVDPAGFYPEFAGDRVTSVVAYVDRLLGAREHPRVPFHLAFPVKDIASTRAFYVGVLGCVVGREAERWIDFDLCGHQLSAHVSDRHDAEATNEVDGDDVPVRHHGVVLPWDEWHALVDRLKRDGASFLIAPRIRFAGEIGEQATFFLRDPSGNAIEIKSFRDRARLFAR